MYKVVESSKGYAIFFVEDETEIYISDNLSLKQANKWCARLNNAYNRGYASNW
jgi:hypothetical protein